MGDSTWKESLRQKISVPEWVQEGDVRRSVEEAVENLSRRVQAGQLKNT